MNLQFFPSAKPNKTGVLVVPGGGYSGVSLTHEGSEIAAWLNDRGFDAWVLNYTTASPQTPSPIYPAPQNEAMQAIAQIRAQNRVTKLGIWGFSAGGHLSAVTVTNPDSHLDFGVLSYPVISMEPGTTHPGSRHNLIGDNPDPALQASLSGQNRVSLQTPPIFLFHTANDPVVPVQNTLLFATAMADHKRPFAVLIIPDGPHGVGLALNDAKLTWTNELDRWLKSFIAP